MALFKCISSGNIITFDTAYDIEQMRRQIHDYVEVDANGVPVKEEDRKLEEQKAKRRKLAAEA